MMSAIRAHLNAIFCALAIRAATLNKCELNSVGRSVHSSTSAIGTTSAWPVVIGFIVMKATQRSSR